MSLVNQEELNAIARLSALTLTDEERVSFTQQLNTIIEYVSSLQTIIASNNPQSTTQRNYLLREDVIIRTDSEAILQQAPKRRDRYFAVPQILE